MQIVVLDAVPLDSGDLDWAPLEALGNVTRYDATPAELVNERLADAEVAYTNKVRLGAANFAAAEKLKLVGVLATGYDTVDLPAARAAGVTVCNVPAYSTESVVQTAFALLLELTHGVAAHSTAVHEGAWCESPTFCFWLQPLVELAGKTFAIVGAGNIGRRVADVANAFGMKVLVADPADVELPAFADRVTLEEAFARADVLSLHCPLNDRTRGLVNAERLATMKTGAFLINAARGPLIDESAVAAALHAGTLGGYGADVLSVEPPTRKNPLLGAPRCVITPHLAWASLEARRRLWATSIANLAAFLAGDPKNVVS